MKVHNALLLALGVMGLSNLGLYLLLQRHWSEHWAAVEQRLDVIRKTNEDGIRREVQALRADLQQEIRRASAEHHGWLQGVVREYRTARSIVEGAHDGDASPPATPATAPKLAPER